MVGHLERRLAALEQQVAALRSQVPAGGNASVSQFAGTAFARPVQVGFPAKLTSTYSATTGYNWSMRVLTPGSATVADVTPTVSGNGAVDVAGRTDLASGTKVWMEPDPNGRGMIFVVSDVAAGFTAEEADGNPSYTSTTTLRFDQADGFVLTQPAAGVTRVDLASASTTQAGVVDTGAQTFAGAKTFNQNLTCGATLQVNSTITSNNQISGDSVNAVNGYYYGGAPGVTGTISPGAVASGGIVTDLGGPAGTYTPTNVTTDRSYDANATTLDEIADVLGTLIADLQAKSILA